MRLGLAAWGLRETPLDRQLAMARRLNVDLLELSIANHPNDFIQSDASPARLHEAKTLFARHGVGIDCAATGNDFTGDDAAAVLAGVDRVRRAVDLAAGLGCRTLRIFAGFSPAGEVTGVRWDRMVDALTRVYGHAAGSGVVPVIETHGGVTEVPGGIRHFASTSTAAASWERMLEALPETARILFDPANLRAVGDLEPEAFYRRFRARIAVLHLKDFAAVPDTGAIRPAACGEGLLDNARLYPALRDFDGPALIEYEIPDDVEDGFRRSLDFVRRIAEPS